MNTNIKYVALGVAALSTLGPITVSAQQVVTAGNLPGLITPGIVGNTVQVGIGDTRIGTPNGLIGKQGTSTTKVGVGVLTKENSPGGSLATVAVPSPALKR